MKTFTVISSNQVQRFFYYRSWTLYPIQEVESTLRAYEQIKWYHVYYDFDNIEEMLLFIPFWKLSPRKWLKRWAWGRRLLDKITARQLRKQRLKNEDEWHKEHGTTIKGPRY